MSSVLVTPIPVNLRHVLDSSTLSGLASRKRGLRTSGASADALAEKPMFATVDDDGNAVPVPLPKPKVVARDAATASIVSLLSPKKDLSQALTLFTNSYSSATSSFSDIFSFPFLENLKAPENAGSGSDADKLIAAASLGSTRQMFLDGQSNFLAWTDFEKQLCRNLIGYATVTSTLARSQTPADLADSVGPIVSKYADQIDAKNAEKADLFKRLIKFSDALKTNINATTTRIKGLSEQIQTMQGHIASMNVGKTLLTLLKDLFALQSEDDKSLPQLAFLLGMKLATFADDFAALYKEKSRLKELVDSLNRLQAQLQTLTTSMSLLASALGSTVEANDVLNEIWSGISDNLLSVQMNEKSSDKLTPTQVTALVKAWQDIKEQANQAVAALSNANFESISMNLMVMTEAAPINRSDFQSPIPTNPAELKLFKMAANAGADELLLDSRKASVMRKLAASPAVANRYVATLTSHMLACKAEAAPSEIMEAAPSEVMEAASNDDEKAQDDLKKMIGYLGPPIEVQDALDKLAGECKAIIQTFSDVLHVPYTDQLQILNPFKTKDAPNEKEKLSIRDIVLRFQAMYLDLQNQSINCVRRLVAYASVQLALLPKVTPFAPKAGQVALDEYLDSCTTTVDNYTDEATKLSDAYTKFGQKWKLCQDNLENAINQSKADADSARNALEKQREQYTKTTIMGVLEIFGALALFAVAAFTMPLGLLAIGAGGYLLYKGIKDLKSLADIDAAIESFKSAAKTADETNKNLTVLREPMKKVADAVAKVTAIWVAIAQNLVNIQTFMAIWSSPKVFISSVGTVTTEWSKVKDNCIAYIGIISGGTPL